ncbi:MAG: hypothetical protein ACQESR_02770 [Planctomycetota bacterium]
MFLQGLDVDQVVPGRTSIGNWLGRLGIDAPKQPADSEESLVIMKPDDYEKRRVALAE